MIDKVWRIPGILYIYIYGKISVCKVVGGLLLAAVAVVFFDNYSDTSIL